MVEMVVWKYWWESVRECSCVFEKKKEKKKWKERDGQPKRVEIFVRWVVGVKWGRWAHVVQIKSDHYLLLLSVLFFFSFFFFFFVTGMLQYIFIHTHTHTHTHTKLTYLNHVNKNIDNPDLKIIRISIQ